MKQFWHSSLKLKPYKGLSLQKFLARLLKSVLVFSKKALSHLEKSGKTTIFSESQGVFCYLEG